MSTEQAIPNVVYAAPSKSHNGKIGLAIGTAIGGVAVYAYDRGYVQSALQWLTSKVG